MSLTKSQPGDMNFDQMLNLVYVICSIFTMPIEIVLRPFYGTRYFQPPVILLSTLLMMFLPIFSLFGGGLTGMLMHLGPQPPPAIFGLGDLSKLYFLLGFVHGFRIWRRMIRMHTEMHSEYEGPPLPFFRILPGSGSFWFTRIVLEPAFVIVLAVFCQRMLVFETGLTSFLCLAAIMLAMKNYVAFYIEWQFLRKLMDMRFSGPIISRMVSGEATQDELATIHIAGFPKDLPSDIHKEAALHIAKAYGVSVNQDHSNDTGE